MADVQALQRKGWYLSVDGVKQCSRDGANSPDAIAKVALDLDLRTIGERHLDETICKNKVEFVNGPFVLQIQKLVNVTAPKDNAESQAAPPMFKLTLFDGHLSCVGLEFEKVSNLGHSTPPGTKVQLTGRVPICHGFLLLTPRNCRILGGHVPALVESWKLKRTLAQHTRASAQHGDGGPPPFIPFGQKYKMKDLPSPKLESTKSLKSAPTEKEKKEDAEFEQQRKATIAEALQAKEEGKAKAFVANNSKQDRDIAKIVEMGFSAEQAGGALRQSGGNIEAAINFLLGEPDFASQGRGRGRVPSQGHDQPMRGHRDRGVEEEEDERLMRPSAPATLFDFLTTKIPAKKEVRPAASESARGTSNRDQHASFSSHTSHSRRSDADSCQSNQAASSNKPPPRLLRNQQGRDGDTTRGQHGQGGREPERGDCQSEAGVQETCNGRDGAQWGSHRDGWGSRRTQRPGHGDRPAPVKTHADGSAQLRQQMGAMSLMHMGSPPGARDHPSAPPRGSPLTHTGPPTGARDHPSAPPRGSPLTHTGPPTGAPDHPSAPPRGSPLTHTGPPPGARDHPPAPPRGSPLTHTGPSPGARDHPSGPPRGPRAPPRAFNSDMRDRSTTQAAYGGNTQESKCSNQLTPGDYCTALYWQDKKLYRAVVNRVSDDGRMCSVTFTDYGNNEQVSTADVRPITKQAWEMNAIESGGGAAMATVTSSAPYHLASVPPGFGMTTSYPPPPMPPSYPTEQAYQGDIGGLEFRQGGDGRARVPRGPRNAPNY